MNTLDQACWYAIRTFNCKEMEVSAFLEGKELPNFVPMAYADRIDRSAEKPRRILVPVIHNYLFLRKTRPAHEIGKILTECQYPMSVIKKKDGTNQYCEISEAEMAEFRLLCDPKFDNSIFMKSEEADAKPGKEVLIIHGPFKGIHGKLYRKKDDYYFIKAFIGIGVMVRISRWYCRPV